jgi:6-pyruvoyltetrahydropterin/6-carboxytetrahydropterin synthase
MFQIQKTFEIAIGHHLNLPYESKCQNDHGHNEIITVWCKATDDEVEKNNGMVIDFTEIKKLIHDKLDHQNLNLIEGLGFDVNKRNLGLEYKSGTKLNTKIDLNPTAENTARWICNQIPQCYKVSVQESSGNIATYLDDSKI